MIIINDLNSWANEGMEKETLKEKVLILLANAFGDFKFFRPAFVVKPLPYSSSLSFLIQGGFRLEILEGAMVAHTLTDTNTRWMGTDDTT